jgi:signal transduction histidine kinase
MTKIQIKDNGYGIPVNAHAKLFSKFFRASNAQTIKPDGTGLGLYITKSIVEALGGTVSFKSKEHVGTTFTVTLPNTVASKNKLV